MKFLTTFFLVLFAGLAVYTCWQFTPSQKERLLDQQLRESRIASMWLAAAARYAGRTGTVDSIMLHHCLTQAIACSNRADSLADIYEKLNQ